MTMKMKGVLKGLRYITQIFENESDDECEMQIGLPTDVKHVAHIGMDGPSTAPTPSWINDFKSDGESTQQSTTVPLNATSEPSKKSKTSKRRTSKKAADGTTQDSQSQDPSSASKQSRKKKAAKGEGSSRGSSSGGSTRSRAKSGSSSSASKNEELGTATGSGTTKTRRKKESTRSSCAGPGSNNDQIDSISGFKTLKLEGNA